MALDTHPILEVLPNRAAHWSKPVDLHFNDIAIVGYRICSSRNSQRNALLTTIIDLTGGSLPYKPKTLVLEAETWHYTVLQLYKVVKYCTVTHPCSQLR